MKNIRTSHLIILVIGCLAFTWSVWGWVNYPQHILTVSEIDTYCTGRGIQSEYCLGYKDGHRNGYEQRKMDEGIEEFEKLTAEEIDTIFKELN